MLTTQHSPATQFPFLRCSCLILTKPGICPRPSFLRVSPELKPLLYGPVPPLLFYSASPCREVQFCTGGFLHNCGKGHRYSRDAGLLREIRTPYTFLDMLLYLYFPIT